MQGKGSSSERRVLPSWPAGLCLLLKSPWECANSHAVQMSRILLWELFVWEMHRKDRVPVFEKVVKRRVSSGTVWLVRVSRVWLRSQRGAIPERRCSGQQMPALAHTPSPRPATQVTWERQQPQGCHPTLCMCCQLSLLISPVSWQSHHGGEHFLKENNTPSSLAARLSCQPFFLFQNSATTNITWLWLQKLGQTHVLKRGHRVASGYLGVLPKGRNRNNQENVLPIQQKILINW